MALEFEELTIDFTSDFKPYLLSSERILDNVAQEHGFDIDPSFVIWRHELPTPRIEGKTIKNKYVRFSAGDCKRLEMGFRESKANTSQVVNVNTKDGMYEVIMNDTTSISRGSSKVDMKSANNDQLKPDLKMRSLYWESESCEVYRHIWFAEHKNDIPKLSDSGMSSANHHSKKALFSKSIFSFNMDDSAPSPSLSQYSPCVDLLSKALEHIFQQKLKFNPNTNFTKPLRITVKQTGFYFVCFSSLEIYVFETSFFKSKSADGKSNGFKVRRGIPRNVLLTEKEWQYEADNIVFETEDMEDAPPTYAEDQRMEKNAIKFYSQGFDHALFVVHGIGQKIEEFDIVQDCYYFRKNLNSQFNAELKHERIIIIPIQWRKSLNLKCDDALIKAVMENVDGDDGDENVNTGKTTSKNGKGSTTSAPINKKVLIEDVTLEGVRPLRNLLNSSFMDVLYYLHPECCQAILDELTESINVAYDKFILRNSNFHSKKGRISLLGHSLGSALVWDLACHQGMNNEDQLRKKQDELKEKLLQKYTKIENNDDENIVSAKKQIAELMSKIDQSTPTHTKNVVLPDPREHLHFRQLPFNIDSLLLLGSPLGVLLTIRGTSINVEGTPNTFGKKDNPNCRQVYNIFNPYDPVAYRLEPLISTCFVDKPPMLIPFHKGGMRFHKAVNNAVQEISQTASRWKNVFNDFTSSANGFLSGKKDSDRLDYKPTAEPNQKTIDFINPDKRLDWSIQDAPLENQYISALSSHNCYWWTEDVALFVLNKMSNFNFTINAATASSSS